MAEEYNVHLIADYVINWGNGVDDDTIDQLYDPETLDWLNSFVLTIINFTNVFEVEFEEIFSKNCTANMSESQFIDFVIPRCSLLGMIEGYFGIILPCAFVMEVMYRFESHFECYDFCESAEECLAKFLQIKFKEFESINNSWNELMDYCKDINIKFAEKIHSKRNLSFKKSFDGDSRKESLVSQNPYPIQECNPANDATDLFPNYGVPHAVSTKSELIVSDSEWANASDANGGDSLGVFDNFSAPRTEDTMQKGTKEFLEMHFSDDDKQHKTEDVPSNTEISETDEFTEMYNIVMPNNEFRIKVFKVVNKCYNFVSKTDIGNFCF